MHLLSVRTGPSPPVLGTTPSPVSVCRAVPTPLRPNNKASACPPAALNQHQRKSSPLPTRARHARALSPHAHSPGSRCAPPSALYRRQSPAEVTPASPSPLLRALTPLRFFACSIFLLALILLGRFAGCAALLLASVPPSLPPWGRKKKISSF
jgi:hypothetical protein